LYLVVSFWPRLREHDGRTHAAHTILSASSGRGRCRHTGFTTNDLAAVSSAQGPRAVILVGARMGLLREPRRALRIRADDYPAASKATPICLSVRQTLRHRTASPCSMIFRVKCSGIPNELGTSNAAPASDKSCTMQLKAPPGNSIIPALRTGLRNATRLSMCL
jgi:hypothetical protein